MKKIVRVSLISVLFLLVAGRMYAQSRVTINPGTFRDSTTFVNLKYITSSSSNEYSLTLSFTGISGTYTHVQVDWGDENKSNKIEVESVTTTQCTTTYRKEGCFPIQMYFFPGSSGGEADTLYAWALNTDLSLSYTLEPVGNDKSFGCLSYGADTLLLRFTSHINPPLTQYTININCSAPMEHMTEDAEGALEVLTPSEIDLSGAWVQACWANKTPGRRDSIWLIFTEATGVEGAEISVKMTCNYVDDKGKEDYLEKKCHQIETIYLFDKPDLKQIFRQDPTSPFPDTLNALPVDEQNFNVCAPGGPNEFGFYGDWFAKYQTFVLSKPSPKQEDRSIFKVKCYYTDDSVWSEKVVPEDGSVKWQDVSGNSEYFNDTTLKFNRAGFYMVRWEITNQCDEENPDTLWTSLVRKDNSDEYYTDKFRYIQVYENQEASLDYLGDSVFCLNGGDSSVILVDRNRRKYYDVPPDYILKIVDMDTRAVIKEDTVKLEDTKIYRDGNILNTGEDAGNFAKVERKGCDSTTITLKFDEPGNYEVTWERKGKHCEEGRTKVFEFHVGDVPVIRDTLFKHFFSDREMTLIDGELFHCGAYEFKVPDLSDAFDSRNRDIDSVRYQFTKGAKDSVLVYKEDVPEASFLFDSTKANYVLLNIYNACGVSKTDSVGFYTPAKPDVSIWRDSVEITGTDSLCLNAEYKYYLHGVLPENCADSVFFSGSVEINGKSLVGGSIGYSKLRKIGENYGLVKYTAKGEFTERYKILNKDFPACSSEFQEKVVVMDAPDSMLYKNDKEILYCASLDTLDTRVLFKKEEDANFKRATWGWKGEIAKDGRFPKLLFREGKDDTLYVNTIQSTNCYFRDTLIFKPQPVPQANFSNAIENICVPDTLKKAEFHDFVRNGNLSLSTMEWKVYKNAYYKDNKKDTLIYDAKDNKGELILNEQSADSLGLIYYMQNIFKPMYLDFSDNGCWSLDTLPLKVHKPHLKILKKDTLDDKDSGVYDFTEIQNNYVETKDLNQDAWTWATAWDGADGSFGDTPPTYALGENDKKLDSLLFILTAHTYCGEPISDTLVVYFPRIVINAHRDTICSTTTDYALWGEGKTTGLFVKTEELEWEIIKDATGGTLTPLKGTEVKFTPGTNPIERNDTVKIQVKGTSTADVGEKLDTVLLWINPAPSYTKLNEGDTLIAIGKEINVEHIKAFQYQIISGAKVKEFRNGSTGWAQSQGDSVVEFTWNPETSTVNNKVMVDITLKALPGCTDSTIYNVPMMDLVYPKSVPKYNPLDLCAEDKYGVDSLFTFEKDRKDRFTKLHWKNDGAGTWEKTGDDTVAFVAGSTGGIGADKIYLILEKQYIAYDSTKQSLSSSSSTRSFSVNVHVEPTINFNPATKTRDTLCKENNIITITKGYEQPGATEWILVNQSYYVDSLRFNGEKLSDNIYNFTKDKGKEDTVFITVNQGRCTKWDTVQKKLYLYRMDEVLDKTKLPTDYKICEGGSVEIEYAKTLDKPYYWKLVTETGTLDSLNKGLKPVYADTAGIDGQIELHVTPHPGCEEETTFTNIEVTKKPRLNLKDKAVCKKKNNDIELGIDFADGNSWSEADSITWYRKGETAKLGKTTGGTEFSYRLTDSDLSLDTLHLVAALWPKTPCDKSPTYDTVKIALSGQPEIILPGSDPVASMCQGDTLDLVKKSGVTVKNAASVQWTVNNWGAIVADTLYVPGEKEGSASLKITAKGVPGCADEDANISVLVRKAPRPDFNVKTSPVCQKGEIELASGTTGVTVESYQWTVENQSYSTASIKHTFEASGQVDVTLQQTYTYSDVPGGQCVREATKPITVNPKPTADFEDIGQVAIGSTVTIHNYSTPATGVTYKWEVAGISSPDTTKDLTLTYNVAVPVGITLTVTTNEGCSDSKSGTVEVVEPPVPDFEVKQDSCGNEPEFTLAGSLNGATVWWDWGTGNGLEQDTRIDMTQPITKNYYVGYQDTTYWVTLELRNAADTVQKKLSVRFVSRLDASFEILPEKTGCHEIHRKIVLDIKGRNDEGYVIWGDKKHNPASEDSLPFNGNINLLSHRFENSTLYPVKDTIRLHVKNTCFSAADSNDLTVLPATAGAEINLLTGSTLCFSEDILKVSNASFGFDKATAEWEWKFESGNSAWVQSNRDTATHRYLSPGVYTVILNMRDRCNSDTAMQEITVKGNDSLYFEIQSHPYCTGDNVTLKFIQKGMPEFSDLRWTIYDPRTGRSVKAMADSTQWTYKFRDTGDYEVLLTAKADGCKDGQTLPLHIDETPEAMISLINGSVAEGCEAHTVEFQAADGSSLRKMPHILWDFQNGVKSSQLKEKVVFENEGTYNVALTLTSDSGCVNTVYQEIIVKHTPRISFVTDDSLFCLEQNGAFEVRIENTSEDLDRCRFEWFKKVGAGPEESILVAPQLSSLHFENVNGTIGLRLLATDLTTQCQKDFTKEIVASDAMKAHIFKEAEYVCLDNPVYFASRTENMVKAEWDMGDGGLSADTAFEYTYDRVGDKMITLRVENKDGCYDIDTLRITVYPLPVVDFVWDKNHGVVEGYPDTLDLPEVDNGGVEFTNYSFVTPDDWGTELYYSWNFGDSTAVNTAKNPTHRFENNGLYKVWLKVTTPYGCVDSTSSTVSIDAVKGLYIPTAFAPAMPDEELGEGNSYMGSARFQPKGIGLYFYQIQVYDPWSGTCVWSSTALKNGQPAEYWDGKFNGADAPAGNYIWKVKAIFIDGAVWQNEKGAMEGMVMLIR